MKLLITGATGLIGRAIVELANKQGFSVNYLTTDKAKIIRNENFKGYYWDPESQKIDIQCFEGVTSIINLAGASISKRWTFGNKQQILASRVNSIKTLIQGLEKVDTSKISSIVSASAIGIYPNSLSVYYSEEEKLIDDSFLGSVVQSWEQEMEAFNAFDIPVAKIRIGMVLSKDGGALPQLIKPAKKLLGAAFGSGKQWQSWIHIADLARMFLFISQNRLQGIYNGVSPNPVTNQKMISEIAKTLEMPLLLPNIPRFAMRAILGEMSYLLFVSHRVSSKKIAEEGFTFQHPTIGNALQYFLVSNSNEHLQNEVSTEEYIP